MLWKDSLNSGLQNEQSSLTYDIIEHNKDNDI